MDRGAWRAPVRGVAESWPRLSEHIPPMPCASQLQATAHTKYSYHFYLPHFSPQITLLQSHGSSLCLPGNLSCLLPCYDFISWVSSQPKCHLLKKVPLCSIPRHILSEFPCFILFVDCIILWYYHVYLSPCLFSFPTKTRAGILSFHHCISSD